MRFGLIMIRPLLFGAKDLLFTFSLCLFDKADAADQGPNQVRAIFIAGGESHRGVSLAIDVFCNDLELNVHLFTAPAPVVIAKGGQGRWWFGTIPAFGNILNGENLLVGLFGTAGLW